ncbi:unnamed protein product [Cylicostephanus goldi]|uniref:Phosphoribosyltransferase domain-containing protein n=1 Tax=Cylicostephanus goldi TaxID=71465 RepID=A0A3P6TEY1_CYLGO|nr:unnamed protein product [Cylicostephanus goldi]
MTEHCLQSNREFPTNLASIVIAMLDGHSYNRAMLCDSLQFTKNLVHIFIIMNRSTCAFYRKSGVLKKNVEGRRIVLVDDSIVRGNTMQVLVQMLLNAGAKEVADVHLRIASPPVKFPCFMGINIPTADELLASNKDLDEITEYFGATSVGYLSVDGLREAVESGIEKSENFDIGHCTACLTGEYPTAIEI